MKRPAGITRFTAALAIAGGHVRDGQLDGRLQRINDRNKATIIEFLKALNDGRFDKTVPCGFSPGKRIS